MRSPTSGDEDDDQYGSEAQVETQEKMGSELSHKYQGPEWDGKKESYTEWRWEATPYLDSLGLESVRRGRNRSVLTTSASSKEAVTMVIALNKLFRVILRMIKRAGTEASCLLPDHRDGRPHLAGACWLSSCLGQRPGMAWRGRSHARAQSW